MRLFLPSMSLPLHKKIYWKTKNAYQANVKYRNVTNHGLLDHREDPRDRKAKDKLGAFFGLPKPKFPSVFNCNDWVFSQSPLNICVFASNVMAFSYQEGKRFCVRAAVVQAKLNGDISGNGFAPLRAGLKVGTKTGYLPIEYLSDDVLPWEQYSQNVLTQSMLDIMAQYKSPEYRVVENAQEAVELIERGYVLITAIKWKSSMNSPQPEEYYLISSGYDIGGHAIMIQGYTADRGYLNDYYNKQTFGPDYANKGVARIKNIFALGFPVYYMEKLANRTDLERFTGRCEGQRVKGVGNPIYLIENGLKRVFNTSWEGYEAWCKEKGQTTDFYTVNDDLLVSVKSGDNIFV